MNESVIRQEVGSVAGAVDGGGGSVRKPAAVSVPAEP